MESEYRTDDRLHDLLVNIVLDQGPQSVALLARRAGRELRDRSIDQDAVIREIEASVLLVPRPSGVVDQVLSVLEGNVLTHRVRAPLAGRNDLWLGAGVQPLLYLAEFRPIPLADGSGTVSRAGSDMDVLIGPQGWLPDVGRYELIGLRITGQGLEVVSVDESDLPPPVEQQRVRRFIGDLYSRNRYWYGTDDSLHTRPAEIARAISLALLEDPDLFATPYPPLDELLHDPLERDRDLDIWREIATCQQVETVSFGIVGMPVALEIELRRRSAVYGMSMDQFVTALLSTLAWRTPFAEDMEPWGNWVPDRGRGVTTLRSVDGEV